MANFLNKFAEMGGFDSIINFLKAGTEALEEKMPFSMIPLILSPFKTCNSLFSEDFAKSFVSEV
jgi:hypothetical protein